MNSQNRENLIKNPWPNLQSPLQLKGQKLDKNQKWFLAQQICLHIKTTKQVAVEHNLNCRTVRYYKSQYVNKLPTYKSRGKPRAMEDQLLHEIISESKASNPELLMNDKYMRKKIREKHKELWTLLHREANGEQKSYHKLSYRTIARYNKLLRNIITETNTINQSSTTVNINSGFLCSEEHSVDEESNNMNTLKNVIHTESQEDDAEEEEMEESSNLIVSSLTSYWNNAVSYFLRK